MKLKLFLLFFCCGLLTASEYELIIKQSPESGILKKGENYSCAVTVKKQGKILTGQKLRLRRLNAFGAPVKDEFHITGDPLVITGKAENSPDWFQLEFSLLDKSGKTIRQTVRGEKTFVRKRAGFITDPEKYTQTYPEPADFDAFWTKAREELKKVPFEITAKALPIQNINGVKVTLQDVQVKCTGGIPVSGYLAIPQNAAPKSLPAVVTFHGAGVHSSSANSVLRRAAAGAVAFDMNAHGVPNGKPAQYYQDLRKSVYYCKQPDGSTRYALRYIRDPQKYYFRGMYQRVMRALELVKKQPQWNGKDLIVIGGSQGGAQVFAAAGLDSQVTLMVATVPAFSEFGGAASKCPRMSGWPLNASETAPLPKDPAVLKSAAYFDNVNFAKRITAVSYVSAGLCDTVCPPPGIIAAFANLKTSQKYLKLHPRGSHGTSPSPEGNAAVREVLLRK